MLTVQIRKCNNIDSGCIEVKKNKLNIKYGINGTGKTTIARALSYSNDVEKLSALTTYGSEEKAKVVATPAVNKTLVFDETFVNQFVFQENEVIKNAFDIFIKTPNYDKRRKELDERLKLLKNIVEEDETVIALREILGKLTGKFTLNKDGISLAKKGTMTSVLSKNNIYSVPKELENYKPFFQDKQNNITWIDWKNKGEKYDFIDRCPYCAEKLQIGHEERKNVFSKTYKKADSQNLKELLDLLDSLKLYLKEEKYNDLVQCVKNDVPIDTIQGIWVKFCIEYDVLSRAFEAILSFGRKEIATTDISKLEEQVKEMEITKILLEYFGGDHMDEIVDHINGKVSVLEKEIGDIKKEMGALKGLIQGTIQESKKDINDFLSSAGINYELEIIAKDGVQSQTILKYKAGDERLDVTDIRNHLSWGEKNAFALILFMYYAQSQNPDLVILDDPISSFDSNKKYAILHRMFKKGIGKKDITLSGQTVLMFTHDFEPITDFVVIGKLSIDVVASWYIWNDNGVIKEKVISPEQDIRLIISEMQEFAKDSNINIVSRIAFLRKYCELLDKENELQMVYEVLSSLIHGEEPRIKNGTSTYSPMSIDNLNASTAEIHRYIPEFDYDELKNNIYNEYNIKQLYFNEQNNYLKLQLFRELTEISEKVRLLPIEKGWFKFIDETYHIENDYLHYLDILKFDIVPNYIIKKVDKLVNELL